MAKNTDSYECFNNCIIYDLAWHERKTSCLHKSALFQSIMRRWL